MLIISLLYVAFTMLRYVPSIPHFLGKRFYHEWMLNFVRCFFCVCWDDYKILPFSLLWLTTLNWLAVLNHPCIPGDCVFSYSSLSFLKDYSAFFVLQFIDLHFLGLLEHCSFFWMMSHLSDFLWSFVFRFINLHIWVIRLTFQLCCGRTFPTS